ncbi:hypothetical protein BO70DRAFT_432548 [Aspergillus heteromorphus CBS 117.55]|uniref:Zn(2)-C6 fungal-type domain-containing protein n=1 Tax=Aspergillus heteromorphus CBS 117.55 TaxID=1448321 RepID=A0A317VAW1_9EURO|nr:uncharacterized protein BO70DRAFT_432548 [Aspergillus heteromorphus CBS 117.55]PWY69050.1 hypothetical protein BO70DRAFT_432548 [Aspergillus heteromorphus CBS 117.55]
MDNHIRRQTRSGRRSRRGCGNCKLRSVKCDETKPACRKCRSYGVSCDYVSTRPDLQAAGERVLHMGVPPSLSFWPNENEYLLSRFQTQIAETISVGPRLDAFRNEVVRLARSTPFLMHAIAALVLMHRRHSDTPPGTGLSLPESRHRYRALTGFNRKLSQPNRPEDTGAMVSTAAMLWFLIFCEIEAPTLEETWPLMRTPSSDPPWLQVNRGKAEVWRLMPSSPTDSIAARLAPVQLCPLSPVNMMALDIDTIPPEFVRLYRLDTTSPYHAVAIGVARALYHDQAVITTILGFVTFCSTMDDGFRRLLLARDPRALLLLACWYRQVRGLGVWWLTPRAWREGEAICVYLERQFSDNVDLQKILLQLR